MHIDTKVINDAFKEVLDIHHSFETWRDDLYKQVDSMMDDENWQGEAKHAFYVYFNSFKNVTDNFMAIRNVLEALTLCEQGFLKIDYALSHPTDNTPEVIFADWGKSVIDSSPLFSNENKQDLISSLKDGFTFSNLN